MLPGPLDRAPQLLLAHRADERLPLLERAGEARVCGAVAVEVGAQGDDDECSVFGAVQQRIEERGALLLVATQREHLFELVDHEHGGVAHGGELGNRVHAGSDDRRGELGTHRALQRWHDARANERRFPAPRRPDDREKTGRLEAPGEIVDERLAPEEEVAVLRLERKQSLVRTRDVGRRNRVIGQPGGLDRLLVHAKRREATGEPVDDELEEPFRLGQVLQIVRAEIAERDRGPSARRKRALSCSPRRSPGRRARPPRSARPGGRRSRRSGRR